jgi:hypothetical protein
LGCSKLPRERSTLSETGASNPTIQATRIGITLPPAASAFARSVPCLSKDRWQNKRQDAERASSVHTTQAKAEEAARRMLGNQGGGELTTMGVKGKIVSKDTIKPGNDPNPPRDTEH